MDINSHLTTKHCKKQKRLSIRYFSYFVIFFIYHETGLFCLLSNSSNYIIKTVIAFHLANLHPPLYDNVKEADI